MRCHKTFAIYRIFLFVLIVLMPVKLSAQPIKFRVFNERISTLPISKFITGNFIERGIGRQVDGMWSEMIYNRTFQENITPFKATAWEAMQLDREEYSSSREELTVFRCSGVIIPAGVLKSFPLAGADALN